MWKELAWYAAGVVALCAAKVLIHRLAAALVSRLCPSGEKRWTLRIARWTLTIEVTRDR